MGSAAMTPDRNRRQMAFDALWLLLWIAVSSAWCVSAANQLSATFDEPLYIATGLQDWRTDSHAGLLRLGTMPLAIDAQTLPLFAYESWRGQPFDLQNDFALLLPWARAITLLFWCTLLLYGWLVGRLLAGTWGGRLSVALLACEPSLLAHASLATTDMAFAACMLALAYHFWVGRGTTWPRRIALPTLWYAAALLSKASALMVGPLCLALLELARLWRTPAATVAGRAGEPQVVAPQLRAAALDIACIVAGGLVLACVYCGSDWRSEPSFVAWARTLAAEAPLRTTMVWLAEQLRIFSNAGEALVRQVRHNIRGHGAYLLGASHPRALWYYFPVLLTIKLSEPILLAALVVAVIARRVRGNWALLLAAALAVVSLSFRVQLGVRMVLPIVVMLIVGVAAGLADIIRTSTGRRAQAAALLAACAISWNAVTAVRVWPQGLAYVNRFWGGTASGYRLVSDSNYDWGQGLKELRRWQQRRGAAPIDVWYFGTDELVRQEPLHLMPLHALPIRDRKDVIEAVRGRLLAVSTTILYGASLSGDAYDQSLAVLRDREPIDRTTTFFIYDFTAR